MLRTPRKATGEVGVIGKIAEKVKEPIRRTAQGVMGVDARLTEEAVEKSNKEFAEKQGTVEQKNKEIRTKAEEGNIAAVEKSRAERSKIEGKNKEAQATYAAETKRVAEENRAAEETLNLRRKTEAELKSKTDTYFAKEDQVRTRAKSENDAKWSQWREKVGDAKADMQPVRDTIERVSAQFPEVKQILRDTAPSEEDLTAANQQYFRDRASVIKNNIGLSTPYDELPLSQKEAVDAWMDRLGLKPEVGDVALDSSKPMSIAQLHDLKTQVGWKVFRHEYPPNVTGAMKQVLKSLEQTEARTSLEAGAIKELEAARTSHGEYQDAFGRSKPKRALEGELRKKEANPKAYSEKEEADRLAAAAKYDPTLASDYREVNKLREKLKALPTEAELRSSLKRPPQIPIAEPLPDLERRVPPEYMGEPIEPAKQEPLNVSELKREQMIRNSRAARGWTRYDSQVVALSVVGPFLGHWSSLLMEPALIAARKGSQRACMV
jgi:hypothetical protein